MSISGSRVGGSWNSLIIWRRLRIFTPFVAAWLIHRSVTTQSSDNEPPDVFYAVQHSIAPEVIKLVLAIGFYFWQRRRPEGQIHSAYHEGLPLNGLNGEGSPSSFSRGEDTRAKPLPQPHSVPRVSPCVAAACGVFAAALSSVYRYNLLLAEEQTEPISVWLTTSLSTLVIQLLSYIFLSRNFTLLQWQTTLLLFSGLCIIQSSLITKILPTSAYLTLAALVLSASLYISFMDFIYANIHSITIPTLHIVYFSCGLIITAAKVALSPARPPMHELGTHLSSVRVLLASASQALIDLALLAAIYFQDGTSASVFQSCSAAAYLLGLGLIYGVYTLGLVAGVCVVIVSALVYISIPNPEDLPKIPQSALTRFVALLGLFGIAVWLSVATHTSALADFGIHQAPERPSTLDLMVEAKTTCPRKPLTSTAYYREKRTYHAFDDVLLVIFFSHARYDVNLDYYREVYSEFFPNMVFVGPGSRQDSGFTHSYDVLVDSYEADEDLSDPTFYKMAGRMAHHMLYTALREYPCYGGYLWAPFDTLLNVPRLQQFDQRFFWYHSPFGKYVYNPALGGETANQNKSRHASPANISPDPSINLTATWRHWGVDWWWGEPHVGVHVCMSAFNKAPLPMREHLVSLTNGTRLIGGSADTMYIPGRHREGFMAVLGSFLETQCFLEIATPTALHLVSPPGDPILYVDHWWIWQPPFNASFVRQQWAQGMEVDTFHTFHWGDSGKDGVWKGNPQNIADVRRLLAESAQRQGVPWTSERSH